VKQTQKIAKLCEAHWRLPPGSVLSDTRGTPRAALARRVAMYLAQATMDKNNWSELGRQFGRDRSTVREAVWRVQREVDAGLDLRALRARLR
jgi:chromosomal replication initiation ATPase DnaA